MGFPPFHPEWLVTFWLTTPGINRLDPHLVLIVILLAIAGVYFYQSKQKKVNVENTGEAQFQYLIKRKTILEDKLAAMITEYECGNISKEVFVKKKLELEKHLELTKKKLQQYIG